MENNQNNQQQDGGNNNKFPKSQILIVLIAALITMLAASMMRSYMTDKSQKELTYDEFIRELEAGEVESVMIGSSRIDIQYKETSEKFNPVIQYYTVPLSRDYMLSERLLENDVTIRQETQDTMELVMSLVSMLLPFVLLVVFMNFMMKRMGGVGKSNARVYMQRETGVTFADVAGQD